MKPLQKRYSLRRLIETVRDAPEKAKQGRPDRDTTRKIVTLERALDEALQNDMRGEADECPPKSI